MIRKVRGILIILVFLQFIIIPIAEASSYWDDTIRSGSNFIESGKANASNITNEVILKDSSSNIYNTLLVGGIVLSVVIGGVLGIQIMWGSIEQQVKAKEMLMPYAAGCIVVFGAFSIWKICLTVFSQL